MLHRSIVASALGALGVLGSFGALVGVDLGRDARAAAPRTITPEDGVKATCFGMSTSVGEVFAVRRKTTCVAETGQCQVATYLADVSFEGRAKTVGYLSFWKGKGQPTDAQLAHTARPEALVKAQAAMETLYAGEACSGATLGDTFTYTRDGAPAQATIAMGPYGQWVVRGDNAQSVTLPQGTTALLWGAASTDWFVAKTEEVEGGTDTTFELVDVRALHEPPPARPGAKAVVLTAKNVGETACLGWGSAGDDLWFVHTYTNGPHMNVWMFRAGRTQTHPDGSVMARPLADETPASLARALATVTEQELALANGALAGADATCRTLTVARGATVSLAVPGKPGVALSLTRKESLGRSTLEAVGPRGARAIVPLDRGTGDVGIVYGDTPAATRLYVQVWHGVNAAFEALDLTQLLGDSDGPGALRPALAGKAPKLFAAVWPQDIPTQDRCRAWSVARRVATIIHGSSTSEDVDMGAYHSQLTLAEVGPDGTADRVTLAKDGAPRAETLAHGDALLARSDRGCVEGDHAEVLGVPVDVSLDGADVVVRAKGQRRVATTLVQRDNDDGRLVETVAAVYWQPEVTALVVAVHRETREGFVDGRDTRFVWVDLAPLIGK